MPDNKTRNEFKIVIDGIELPEELVARIDNALQKAALNEIASIDFRGTQLLFHPIMSRMVQEGNGGSTGGAHIKFIEAE